MPCIVDKGNQNLLINGCIISYPTLFTPKRVGKPGQETGEPRYSANFILPVLDAADVALLTQVATEAVRQRWPAGDAPATDATYQARILAVMPGGWWPGFSESHNCAKPPIDQYPDRFVLSANSAKDRRPDVFINGRLATPDQASQVFGGCVVNVVVRIFAYTRGSNGITVALNGVQLVDNVNVVRLDGGISAAAAFGVDTAFPEPTSPPPVQPGPAVPAHQQVAPGVVPGPVPPGPAQLGPPPSAAPAAPVAPPTLPGWMR